MVITWFAALMFVGCSIIAVTYWYEGSYGWACYWQGLAILNLGSAFLSAGNRMW